jgi:hypothetical protein
VVKELQPGWCSYFNAVTLFWAVLYHAMAENISWDFFISFSSIFGGGYKSESNYVF